ncbi:MBL fold metallo-hydrolase [Candidatus Woesearchaeota archaeon]|nr:MBL fold metallo-hydrolase [Candidatus Woesearchaeota archaeon]
MVSVHKVSDNVFEIRGESSLYILLKEKLAIDTGFAFEKKDINLALKKVIPPEEVKIVVFTHLHMDHIGNLDLFTHAKFYASAQAIKDFKANPLGTVLEDDAAKALNRIQLSPIKSGDWGLEVIEVPGHTAGSIALYYKKEKILFTGDTKFRYGYIGRVDLPTSVPKKIKDSLQKLEELDYEIMCPGHNY